MANQYSRTKAWHGHFLSTNLLAMTILTDNISRLAADPSGGNQASMVMTLIQVVFLASNCIAHCIATRSLNGYLSTLSCLRRISTVGPTTCCSLNNPLRHNSRTPLPAWVLCLKSLFFGSRATPFFQARTRFLFF